MPRSRGMWGEWKAATESSEDARSLQKAEYTPAQVVNRNVSQRLDDLQYYASRKVFFAVVFGVTPEDPFKKNWGTK